MIKLKLLILFAAAFLFPPAVFSQSGVSIEAEIQNTQRIADSAGITALERHDALVRLARLRQLSGDIEGAAKNWLEAAAAIPGQVDDEALLTCAYCLAAMGEWDRAMIALDPLLTKSARARFLYAGILALNTGNISALSEIAGASEYSQMKSEIYYLLWKISEGSESERWRLMLVSEFPQSPEGRLAAGDNQQAVILRPNPFWLFLGWPDSLPIAASVISSVNAANIPVPSQTITQTVQTNDPYGEKLQTGLYNQEPNAQTQAARLRQAGFSPSIEKRITGLGEMWAVIVFAGQDTNRTIKELKDAGFDSFPLR